jgi:sarcosine oxidase/L-pipecolate oxidase
VGHLELVADKPQKNGGDMKRLEEKEKADPETRWRTKIDAFRALEEGRLDGFIDTSAGFTYADKVRRLLPRRYPSPILIQQACAWARFLCEKEGVKFVLGPEVGKFADLLVDDTGEQRKVTGLRTADGKEHLADVVVVACECLLNSIAAIGQG